MKIKTEQFGVVEIEEGKRLLMPTGMPGFLGRKHFSIIEREEIWPFSLYQCLDDENLSFFIMDPNLFKPDYLVDLAQVSQEMGWSTDDLDQIKLYAIVNTSCGIPEKITANLLGPLVVNMRLKESVQLVLHNSPYSHKYPIFNNLDGYGTESGVECRNRAVG